jgi:hypothetical protein
MSAELRGYLLLAFSTHCVRKHRNPSSPGQWLGRSYITFPVADKLLAGSNRQTNTRVRAYKSKESAQGYDLQSRRSFLVKSLDRIRNEGQQFY